MTITMRGTRTYIIPELKILLASLEGVSFKAESKAESCDWTLDQLFKYKFDHLISTFEAARGID
jgi:hypothetical protein